MRKIVILFVFFVLAPLSASALNFDLEIEGQASSYFYEEEEVPLEEDERYYGEAEVILPARLNANNWELLLEPRIRVDSEEISQGGEDPRDFRRPIVGVREAYFAFWQEKLELRLGYQIADWSMTDTVSPSDNLNPLDLTLIPDWERRSIPLVTARYGYDTYLEAAYKPFFSPSFLPDFKWKREKEGVEFLKQKEEEDKAQFALRAGGIFWGTDWQICYYQGYADSPYAEVERLTLSGVELRPRYSEEEVGSLGLARDVFAGVVFRAEAGYFSQDYGDDFYQYVVGLEKHWQSALSLGDELFFLVQYSGEEVAEEDEEITPLTDFRRIFRDCLLVKAYYQ